MATKTLYDTDFAEWSDRMAALIRAGQFNEIDAENVAEEIESLGKRDRKSVRSQLQRLMMYKLKQILQPGHDCVSWHKSIGNARAEILDDLLDSPSLRRHLRENLQVIYQRAAAEAREETGIQDASLPMDCPWDLDTLLA